MDVMDFKTADVAGVTLFYREAGDASQPTIVLLHGFPSSSHQFHDLIPLLEDRFHVLAPDYPGMGYSEAPDPTVLRPTFDDVASAIDAFLAQRAPAWCRNRSRSTVGNCSASASFSGVSGPPSRS